MKRTRLKRTVLKKKSTQSISTLQDKIWDLCKFIIRKKYPNICYTCGATGLMTYNHHTGHMWAKASLGAYMKYDLRILRPQCFRCNMKFGGMGAEFYRRMLEEVGPETMAQLERDRLVILDGSEGRPKAREHYEKIHREYTEIAQALASAPLLVKLIA